MVCPHKKSQCVPTKCPPNVVGQVAKYKNGVSPQNVRKNGVSPQNVRVSPQNVLPHKMSRKIEFWLNRDTLIIGHFRQKDISDNQICAMVMVDPTNPSDVAIGTT